MKRLAFITLLAFAFVPTQVAATASDAQPAPLPPISVTTETTTTGSLGATGTTLPGGPPVPAPTTAAPVEPVAEKPTTEYETVPVCLRNADRIPCADVDVCTPPAILEEIYSLTPPATNWIDTNTRECVGGPDGPTQPAASDDALAGAAGQQANQLLGLIDPTPALDPGTTTLVNLPTILTAGAGQTQQSKDTTILGVAVTITGTPEFHWSLQGPPDIDTSDPGTAYDGTDPKSDPGHYVTATWTGTGERVITLTVTWAGTLTRHDTGQTFSYVNPAIHTATTRITVKQSRAILTGNS